MIRFFSVEFLSVYTKKLPKSREGIVGMGVYWGGIIRYLWGIAGILGEGYRRDWDIYALKAENYTGYIFLYTLKNQFAKLFSEINYQFDINLTSPRPHPDLPPASVLSQLLGPLLGYSTQSTYHTIKTKRSTNLIVLPFFNPIICT